MWQPILGCLGKHMANQGLCREGGGVPRFFSGLLARARMGKGLQKAQYGVAIGMLSTVGDAWVLQEFTLFQSLITTG